MYLSHNIVKNLIALEHSVRCLAENRDGTKQKRELSRANDTDTLFYLVNEMGFNLSLKDTEKLVAEKKIVTKDFRGDLVENLKATIELSRKIALDKNVSNNLNVMLDVNKSIGGKVVEDWQLNYRAAGEDFSRVFDNMIAAISPQTQLAAGASETYANSVNELLGIFSPQNEENRFLQISRFCLELIRLHPFITYNKYTILFIAHTLISKTVGYENNLINLGEFFTQNVEEIVSVARLDDEIERNIKWNELFIGFCNNKMSGKYKQIVNEVKGSSAGSDKPFLDLNKRQLKILKYLQTIPTVKREDYVQMMDVSTMTAYRDLQQLVKNKLLRTTGTGRGTKYLLASR